MNMIEHVECNNSKSAIGSFWNEVQRACKELVMCKERIYCKSSGRDKEIDVCRMQQNLPPVFLHTLNVCCTTRGRLDAAFELR